MLYFINEAKNMPSGQGRKLNLKSEQIYPVLCLLLLAFLFKNSLKLCSTLDRRETAETVPLIILMITLL